jgi:cobalamin 5'-phosphate synthase/cobalamin synthase
LLAAVAFLTRVPVGLAVALDAGDVARSAAWFPLVGLMLGAVYWLVAGGLRTHLPAATVGVVLVILDALATGALHYDALADTADGFGGGRTREDVLRIMRDHAIGSYGGVALAALVALKATAYAALLGRADWAAAMVLAPMIGRWSMLLLTAALPYARTTASAIEGMGRGSLVIGTLTLAAAGRSARAWIAVGVCGLLTACFGFYCRRRIGGITGDTLGANLQMCECAALLTFLWTA